SARPAVFNFILPVGLRHVAGAGPAVSRGAAQGRLEIRTALRPARKPHLGNDQRHAQRRLDGAGHREVHSMSADRPIWRDAMATWPERGGDKADGAPTVESARSKKELSNART